MPVSIDVMKLVAILDDEGFSALAGELLTEVALGRELDVDGQQSDLEALAERKIEGIEVPDGSTVPRVYFDEDGGIGDAPAPRQPIPSEEQLELAVTFLLNRLVEPMRHLAKAEVLAGLITTDEAYPSLPLLDPKLEIEPTGPLPAGLRIAFVPVTPDGDAIIAREAAPGSMAFIEELANVLARISSEEVEDGADR